jgi:hypothetical protein
VIIRTPVAEIETKRKGSPIPSLAFYCVADEEYFPGAAALLNSIRLLGHDESVFVLDCGLTAAQRDLLASQATVIESPSDAPPWLLKTVAPLAHPAEVMVLLDADMLLTRALTDLIEQAARGHLIAFRNPIDRFVPEWGELLDLGPARRGPYVCSGAVCVDRDLGTEVLRLLEERQGLIDFDRTYWRRNDPDYPFLFGDQDALNAIISARVDPDLVLALDQRLAATPPYTGLRLIDAATLVCRYEDGAEPYLLHQYLPLKPWLGPAHHGVYSRLLRRLLLGADVAVKVPESELPLRLRTGLLAYAGRSLVNARERVRWHIGEPLADRGTTLVDAVTRRRRAEER